MITDLDIIYLVLTALVSGAVMFIAGYSWGSYHERRDWNNLIKEGRIPHPVVEPHKHYATVKYRRS
jgi:hypothetical protein